MYRCSLRREPFKAAGAALLVPCSLALIGAAFDEKDRGAGPSASGRVRPRLPRAPPRCWGAGWSITGRGGRFFLINPLLAIPTVWIALFKVPESRDPNAPPVIDWRGALLAFAGLACLVYGLISSSELGWRDPAVVTSLSAAMLLLLGFVLAERRSRWPMMPLELFRSRMFSGVNLLTLLLYGALGGAFFFLPFLLIQAQGYSATAAGAVYLPFTLVLGALSRWSGGLLDRFGARAPLIAGPTLTALGFLCLAAGRPYWATLLSMTLLGFGMAITVAPLTASVLNAVPAHRTGDGLRYQHMRSPRWSSLLLIAVLGTVALGSFDRSLDRRLAAAYMPRSSVTRTRFARHAVRLSCRRCLRSYRPRSDSWPTRLSRTRLPPRCAPSPCGSQRRWRSPARCPLP